MSIFSILSNLLEKLFVLIIKNFHSYLPRIQKINLETIKKIQS